MLIIFAYKGNINKEVLRDDIVDRYNDIIGSTTYARLYYDDSVPYMTDGRSVSITHTRIDENSRIELIAIGDEVVGIDIESRTRHVKEGLARRYFTESELEYIGDDESRVIEVWQKKEAKGKALKIGMYRDDILCDDAFREFDLYEGYRVVVYGGDREVVFVTI